MRSGILCLKKFACGRHSSILCYIFLLVECALVFLLYFYAWGTCSGFLYYISFACSMRAGIFDIYCPGCGTRSIILFWIFSDFLFISYCILITLLSYGPFISVHFKLSLIYISWYCVFNVLFLACGTCSDIVYFLLFPPLVEHAVVLWNFLLCCSICVMLILYACCLKNKRKKKVLCCIFFRCEQALVFCILVSFMWNTLW